MIKWWEIMQLHTLTGWSTMHAFNEAGELLHGFMVLLPSKEAINIILFWRLLSCQIHSTTTCSQMTLDHVSKNKEVLAHYARTTLERIDNLLLDVLSIGKLSI
jgi:hypothetical protein